MIPAYYGLTTLARHILDIIIVFVCLIGAVEIRSYACVSDDEFDSALKELNRTQELQDEELAENYRCSKPRFKDQSVQTERIVIVTTSPPLYVQRKSCQQSLCFVLPMNISPIISIISNFRRIFREQTLILRSQGIFRQRCLIYPTCVCIYI